MAALVCSSGGGIGTACCNGKAGGQMGNAKKQGTSSYAATSSSRLPKVMSRAGSPDSSKLPILYIQL